MRFNCWRAPTVLQRFVGRSTPTKTPAGRKNPEHVGVFRRSSKGLRACPRQHLRRIPANEIQLLACPDGAPKICGEVDANTLMSIIKKRMFTLYKRQSPRKKVKNHTIWALVWKCVHMLTLREKRRLKKAMGEYCETEI